MNIKPHLGVILSLGVFCGFSYEDIVVKQSDSGSVSICKRDGSILWSQDGDVRLYSLVSPDYFVIKDIGESIYIQNGVIYFVYVNFKEKKGGADEYLCKIDEQGSEETRLPSPSSARLSVQFEEMADGKFACIRDYRLQQFNLCIIDAASLSVISEYQGGPFFFSDNRKSIAYICKTLGVYAEWSNIVIDGLWIYPMKHVGYINFKQFESFGLNKLGPYCQDDGKGNLDISDRCKISVASPLIWTKNHEGQEGVLFLARYGLTGEVRAVFAYLDDKKEPNAMESQPLETRHPFLKNGRTITGYDEPSDLTLFEIESWKGDSLTYKPFVSELNKTLVESRTVDLVWSDYEN